MRLLDKPTARTSDAWFANQTDAFFVSSFSQHLQFLLLVGGGNERLRGGNERLGGGNLTQRAR